MSATKISFYLLENTINQGKLTLACRLASKAYGLGHAVYIHAQNDEMTRKLDDLLWTFSQSSFIPHGRLSPNRYREEDSPVAIGEDPPPPSLNNVLISLLDDVPPYYANFQRVLEAVDNDEQDKTRARQRFKVYRSQGCQPSTHHISL